MDTPGELKKSIGGDTIRVDTKDNIRAAKEIEKSLRLQVIVDDGEVFIKTDDGESLLPKLIELLSIPVNSVSVHRPTLEDVFLHLTGRKIRDEQGNAMASMRSHVRALRRR